MTTIDDIIYEFDPRNVDVSKCAHNTVGAHHCVHDWRIGDWGNAPRVSE